MMSDTSSEDNQLKKEIASRYYENLQDFECPIQVEYLRRCGHCLTKRQRNYIKSRFPGNCFSNFLQEFPGMFFLENDMVTQYDDSLKNQRQEAVEYFEKILNDSLWPVDIGYLRGRIDQANDFVVKFINTFYPGEKFLQFLESSDAFVVYKNNTAWSTSNECAQFYERLLRKMGQGVYYYHLLMNSSRASSQIEAFRRNKYPGEQFRVFLEENSDYFQVNENGFVYFRENETDSLEDQNSVFEEYGDNNSDQQEMKEEAANFIYAKVKHRHSFSHFTKMFHFIARGAPKWMKVFINTNYPGERFKSLLLSAPHHFIVKPDGKVSLTEKECISFLESRLRFLGGSLHYTRLLFHIDQAHRNIRNYMRYYDYDTSFKEFLQNYPEQFSLDAFGIVSLADKEPTGSCSNAIGTSAAEYFEQCLMSTGSPHYMDLREYLGQASQDVIDYINQFYPSREFKSFLLNQPNFIVNHDGIVSSTKNRCIPYFENILKEIGGEIYWYNLQLHLQRAAPCIRRFFRYKYPGEEFGNFFRKYRDVFRIDNDGLVSLIS